MAIEPLTILINLISTTTEVNKLVSFLLGNTIRMMGGEKLTTLTIFINNLAEFWGEVIAACFQITLMYIYFLFFLLS